MSEQPLNESVGTRCSIKTVMSPLLKQNIHGWERECFPSVLQGEQSPGSYRWKEEKPSVALIKWLKTAAATLGQFQTQSPLFFLSSLAKLYSYRQNPAWFSPETRRHTNTTSHLICQKKVGGQPRWYTVKPWQAFNKRAKLEVCKHPSMPATRAHPPPPYLLWLQPTDWVSQVCQWRASHQACEL